MPDGRNVGLGRIRTLAVLAVLAVALGTAFYVRGGRRTERIPGGVRVGAVDLGGLGPDQAAERLLPYLTEQAERPLSLRWHDRTWRVTAAQAGFSCSLDEALGQALAVARSQSWWDRAWGPSEFTPRQVALTWRVDEAALSRLVDRLAAEIDRSPRNASYDIRQRRVVPDEPGRQLDRVGLRRLLEVAVSGGAAELDLPVRDVPAGVRREDVEAVGHQMLSTYTTRVNLADPDRVTNILLAVRRIDGTLVLPGKAFSFNGTVGPREPQFGFRQAKELYRGEYVLGYGGGVCQVSSTLYNAALLADMQIVERSHHSRPLSYVDLGLDATVAYQYLDFQFQNSSGLPVLVAAVLNGDRLTVSLLGRPYPASKRVEILTRDLATIPPGLEEELDDTLPWRSRQILKEGEPGYEVTVIRRVYEGGRLAREETISRDKYPAQPGLVRVGLHPPNVEVPNSAGQAPLTPGGTPAVTP